MSKLLTENTAFLEKHPSFCILPYIHLRMGIHQKAESCNVSSLCCSAAGCANIPSNGSLNDMLQHTEFKQERQAFSNNSIPTSCENACSLNYKSVTKREIVNDLYINNISYAISTRYDDNSEFNNSNTSRIEFIYNISNNYRMRSAYGTAIKNPTFTERFGYYTNFIGNPDLEPEKSKNIELGFDIDLEKKYFFSGTFFRSKLENEINGNAIDPTTFGFTAKNIAGLSKRQGMELASKMLLNENLSINLTYTYTDSVQFNNDAYVDEVRRPRNIGSMKVLWKRDEHSFLNLNVQYVDEQIDVVYPENVILPSFTLLNLGAEFLLNDKLTLNISFNNLLDESYEEIYGYSALGFSAGIGIRYKF